MDGVYEGKWGGELVQTDTGVDEKFMSNSPEWQWRVRETLFSRSCWKIKKPSLETTDFPAHYPPTQSP